MPEPTTLITSSERGIKNSRKVDRAVFDESFPEVIKRLIRYVHVIHEKAPGKKRETTQTSTVTPSLEDVILPHDIIKYLKNEQYEKDLKIFEKTIQYEARKILFDSLHDNEKILDKLLTVFLSKNSISKLQIASRNYLNSLAPQTKTTGITKSQEIHLKTFEVTTDSSLNITVEGDGESKPIPIYVIQNALFDEFVGNRLWDPKDLFENIANSEEKARSIIKDLVEVGKSGIKEFLQYHRENPNAIWRYPPAYLLALNEHSDDELLFWFTTVGLAKKWGGRFTDTVLFKIGIIILGIAGLLSGVTLIVLLELGVAAYLFYDEFIDKSNEQNLADRVSAANLIGTEFGDPTVFSEPMLDAIELGISLLSLGVGLFRLGRFMLKGKKSITLKGKTQQKASSLPLQTKGKTSSPQSTSGQQLDLPLEQSPQKPKTSLETTSKPTSEDRALNRTSSPQSTPEKQFELFPTISRGAAEDLITRYKNMELHKLKELYNKGDKTAQIILDNYAEKTINELIHLKKNGDLLASKILDKLPKNFIKEGLIIKPSNPQLVNALRVLTKTLRKNYDTLREIHSQFKNDIGLVGLGATDIEPLVGQVFGGLSPKVRKVLKAIDENLLPKNMKGDIKSPSTSVRGIDHAEEAILNQLDFILKKLFPDITSRRRMVQGKTVWLVIEQKACSTCVQGFEKGKGVAPGILKQFSDTYKDLTIEFLVVESSELVDDSFIQIIKNGEITTSGVILKGERVPTF